MSTASPLQRAILRTLAWFDVFDRPLMVPEITRWLDVPPGETLAAAAEEDIRGALGQAPLTEFVEADNGFWFLRGRRPIVQTRGIRTALAMKKWRVATTVARWLHLAPFVKMVGVGNTLAMDVAREESDIDFFIITTPGRMWTARAIVTALVHGLGYRRYGDKIKDRVCLSFYVTSDAMDMAPLRLHEHDHYLLYWTPHVTPLIDDGVYEKFRAANEWTNARLPQAWNWDWRQRLVSASSLHRALKKYFEFFFTTAIGQQLEFFFRDRQLKKMDQNIHSKAKLGTTEVMITEDILKFHEDDRRARYNAAFEERLHRFGPL